MSSITTLQTTLFRLYEHYVGEPDAETDVYGYWVFIVGYLVGAAGLGLFIVGYAGGPDSYLLIRISGVAAAAGLALGLFGIVLMLPVRKRGVHASAVGLVVALAGVASFGIVYPNNWRELGAGLDVEVIAVYSAGIVVIAGVTALVPVLTGKKGRFVEEEGVTEDPPILTGDAHDGAQFAAFRDENGDWGWHVLHLEALAAHQESSPTRPDARERIERVKSKIGSAGLMELTTSAFRLYEREDETWEWTLVRDDGSVVADCPATFEERDGVEGAVSFLKDRGPGADVIEIDGAAFAYSQERDRWHWELLDDEHRRLATSAAGHRDQGRAEEAAVTFAERFDGARLLDVEHVGVELRDDAEGWSWRFVDDADEELAASTETFDSRRDAEETVEALLAELDDAAITVAGEPSYELYESGTEWHWRLVDAGERVVARGPSGVDERAEAERTTDRFAEHAAGADVVGIDAAEYEVFPADGEVAPETTATDLPATAAETPVTDGGTEVTDGGTEVAYDEAETTREWNWRLVTEDREVVAASTEPHGDPAAAEAAIERVRQQAAEADLIEFEESAFQVYEADSGEWRWRLIDEDGNVLADSGAEHASRGEAAEAMVTLKEQAPDAELLEIETAAFELFVDEDDRWGWRLIDEAGKLVAEDPATHPTRNAARAAMDRLLEHLDSDVRTMDRAIFQTYADDDWRWRFVLPDGETVAVGSERVPTRDELVEEIGAVREPAATADTYRIGDVAVQLYRSGDWYFRLLDRDREPIADATISHSRRGAVQAIVEEIERHATEAPIFTIEDAAIRPEERGDGWGWQLVDADREVIARSADTEPTREALTEVVADVRRLAPMAGRVDFDVASFDVQTTAEGRWRWRLLDEDGRPVARGAETYPTNEEAREAIAAVRGLIDDASILELDGVSFELHTAEDGWVWRLVDRHGSTMSESTKTYETRTDAREAMNAVKSHAPEGWITFTE